MVALALKLIQEDVRLPDGLVVAYPPFRVQYAPSPSRMLSLMDPLLPPGVLKACLRAYAGTMHGDIINDTGGSFSSIRTPVFEDFYNPFDVDLGDVAYASRIRNVNELVGKRSFSDSNLVTRGKHYMPMGTAGLRNEKERSSDTEYRGVQGRIDDQGDENGLHMHPISRDAHDQPSQKTITRNVSEDVDKICEKSEVPNGDVFGGDLYKQNRTICSKITDLDHIDAASGSDEVTPSIVSVIEKEVGENADANPANKKDHVVLRRTRLKTIPHHRRSLSDTIAESFQRLRPNSGDFSAARTLSDHDAEKQNQHESFDETDIGLTSPTKNMANLEIIDQQNNTMRKKESFSSFSKKDEFTAIYIKETSDCVILDRESGEISRSSCTSTFEKIEKVYERHDSSNSISSSVKQRSRDPLMSPLLASDDLLKKLPKLIIVVSIYE